jgi:HAD superfamily hydrolase (TIGR01549 family)
VTESPPRLPALLWDIDGTLIDTTSLISAALDHVYRRFFGRSIPPGELRAIIGTPLSSQIRIFGEPEDLRADPAEIEAEFIRFYESNRHLERIVQAAVEALIFGRTAGRPTALVTSKNSDEIANTVPRLGIGGYADAIVSADDVQNPKPNPEGVLLALRRLKVAPAQAIFIGDTVHDMRAAAAAGVRRCGVTWGAAPRGALERERPDMLCEDPTLLRSILGL